jgi:hypothetical protein
VVLHAHAITEDGATRERAGGIDREHPDALVVGAQAGDERVGERRLPRARSAGDADGVRDARRRVERGDRDLGVGTAGLDQGDQARDRATIAGARSLDERERFAQRLRRLPRLR